MPTKIRFGTDGWRAVIGDDYTFANVRLCAQSVAQYLEESGMASRGLVVGYDTRFASERFARAVAEVVAANGIKTYLCDRFAPTPAISYAILDKEAAGAVVITASHNPQEYNGFKYKPEYAGSASPEVVAALEEGIDELQAGKGRVKVLPFAEVKAQGLVEEFDPRPAYLNQLAGLVDLETIRKAGLVVGVDSMYGSGMGYFSALLRGGETQIVELNAEHNPLFPGMENPEPIGRNLGRLGEMVREKRADVGLATDGDADRLGLVDEKGDYVDQLRVYGLLLLYLLEVRGMRGPAIRTITCTVMADKLGALYGIPVYETPVGFKFVGPKMMETGAILGGEESGGFGFRGHIPERDGVLAGLYILDLIVKMGKSPSELVDYLFQKVGPHYYDRIDSHFPLERKEAIIERLTNERPESLARVAVRGVNTIDGFKYDLADGSWLLIRFSGTEPIIRIYSEAESPERVQELLEEGQRLAAL